MQRLKNALRDRRGETIVEVLVAFVLLMLFLALFTASLRFARRASAQAQTTRAYLLTEALYPVNDDAAEWKNESGTKTMMSFSRGDRTVFAVEDVEIQTIQAKVKDDNDEAAATHTFTRYYKKVDEDKDDTKEDTTP